MKDQFDVFGGVTAVKRAPSEEQKKKRNFLARFQRWSDRRMHDPVSSEGKCGYGAPCDHCKSTSLHNPCARALNAMIRETGIEIDYDTADPADVWYGEEVGA